MDVLNVEFLGMVTDTRIASMPPFAPMLGCAHSPIERSVSYSRSFLDEMSMWSGGSLKCFELIFIYYGGLAFRTHHSRAGDAHESQRRNHHEQPRTNKTDAANRLELPVVFAESSAAGV